LIRRVTPAGRELLASLVRDGTEIRTPLQVPRSLAPLVPVGVSMVIAALAAGAFAWFMREPASREPDPPAVVAADSTDALGAVPEREEVERAADLALLRRLAAGRRAFALAAGGDTLRARTARERLEARTLYLVEQRLAQPDTGRAPTFAARGDTMLVGNVRLTPRGLAAVREDLGLDEDGARRFRDADGAEWLARAEPGEGVWLAERASSYAALHFVPRRAPGALEPLPADSLRALLGQARRACPPDAGGQAPAGCASPQ
jgi:hypothetical protein